jgi:uncharacterized protein (DUF885 family)
VIKYLSLCCGFLMVSVTAAQSPSCLQQREFAELVDSCGVNRLVKADVLSKAENDLCTFPSVFADKTMDSAINQFRVLYIDLLSPEVSALTDRPVMQGEYYHFTLKQQQAFACAFDQLHQRLNTVNKANLNDIAKVELANNQDWLVILSNLVKSKVGLHVDMSIGTVKYAPWVQGDGLGIQIPPFSVGGGILKTLQAAPRPAFKSAEDVARWTDYLKNYQHAITGVTADMREGLRLGYRGHTWQIDPIHYMGKLYSFWDPASYFFVWENTLAGKKDFAQYGNTLAHYGADQNAEIEALVSAGKLAPQQAQAYKTEHAKLYESIKKQMADLTKFIKGDYLKKARTSPSDVGLWAVNKKDPQIGEKAYEAIVSRRTSLFQDSGVPCIRKVKAFPWTPKHDPYEVFLDTDPKATVVQKINVCGKNMLDWFTEQKLYYKDRYEISIKQRLQATHPNGDMAALCKQEMGRENCRFKNLAATYAYLRTHEVMKRGVDYRCEEHFNLNAKGQCQETNTLLKPATGLFASQSTPGSDGYPGLDPKNPNATQFYRTLATNYVNNYRLVEKPLRENFSEKVVNIFLKNLSKTKYFGGSGASATFTMDPETTDSRVSFYTRDPRGVVKITMPMVQLHELFLGHGLQIPVAKSLLETNKDKYSFTRNIFLPTSGPKGSRTALLLTGTDVEGWAMYTEVLAAEAGFYNKLTPDGLAFTSEPDPVTYLANLADSSRVAARMVVDTGLNSRLVKTQFADYFEAERFMLDNTQLDQSYAKEFTNRVFQLPGQSVTYGPGALAILYLRNKAKTELGSAFNIKDFHDVVIGETGDTLRGLTQAVENYIARKQVVG